MDIKEMFAPTSDQLDAVDLIDAPRTFTVSNATEGPSENQPLNVHFSDFPRPWRPNKGQGRILKKLWGTDTTTWTGRQVTLRNNPEVWFGKENTGGLRITHLSHIDGPVSVPVRERGKIVPQTVQPLAATDLPTPTGPTAEDVYATRDLDALKVMWSSASATVRKLIEAHVADIKSEVAS